MLDLHTHILPGVDDGSRSVEQSLAMLECEAKQGVDTVVLTPHFLARRESPTSFLMRRSAAEQKLRAAMSEHPGLPDVLLGAEVAFFDGMCRSEELDLLCIGNTRAMLIEMPFCEWNRRMLNELEEIQHFRGIQPILAHVERYRSFLPDGLIQQLSDNGVWIQINASHVLRWQTSRRAMNMLKRQSVNFVASDCHNLEQRKPNVGEAIQKIRRKLGNQGLELLGCSEAALLGGMK